MHTKSRVIGNFKNQNYIKHTSQIENLSIDTFSIRFQKQQRRRNTKKRFTIFPAFFFEENENTDLKKTQKFKNKL